MNEWLFIHLSILDHSLSDLGKLKYKADYILLYLSYLIANI